MVVVLLTGGRPAVGPMAAGIAWRVYRNIEESANIPQKASLDPPKLVGAQICCGR